MKNISLTLLIFLVATLGMHTITYALADFVQIKLRQHTFLIPKHVAMERNSMMPNWLRKMNDLDDDSNTILFKFDDEEIKAHVGEYLIASDNQFKDDIEGLIGALSPQELDNYKNPESYAQLADLWLGKGSYKDLRVEPAEESGWYKVYRAVEYPNSWVLVNQYPDPEKPVPGQVSDFWIASCLLQGPESKRNGRCRTFELVGDIVIEFSVSDYNVPSLKKIRDFVRGQVLEWKQD